MVERPGLLDRLIIIELEFVELDSIPGQVNGRLAQRSQVAPSHGQKHISVQSLIVLEDQRFIALENLEENDDIRVADVGRVLVDDELLVPKACIGAIFAHVVELCADRQQKVAILFCDVTFRVNNSNGLLIGDAWHRIFTLCQILARPHVHNMHSTERMHNVRVQLQIACLIDADLHG